MRVRKYKCIRSFGIECYDDEGNVIESDRYFIEKDSLWRTTQMDFVDYEISLENEDKDSSVPWIGLDLNTLNTYFREVE